MPIQNKNKLLVVLSAIILICYGSAWLIGLIVLDNDVTIKPKVVKIYKKKVFSLESVENITVDDCAADVVIKTGNSDSIICVLTGEVAPRILPDYQLTGKKEGSVLKIGTLKNNLIITGSFVFRGEIFENNLKLEVFLPAGYNKKICLNNSTDTRIDNLNLDQLEINSNSGDLKADSLKVGKLKIGQSSGDLDINYIKAIYFDCRSSSGEINIGTLLCDSLYLITSSGNLKIKQLTAQKTEISGSSSDIEIENCVSDLVINNSSGDINVSGLEKNTEINSTSGSITVNFNLMTDFIISAETTSGNVTNEHYPVMIEEKNENILKGYHGNPLTKISLTATSGDIVIEK